MQMLRSVLHLRKAADHCVHLPPDTKKRRIVLIVVLCNQSVFQRLMLLDYQIELDLASGMVLAIEFEWVNWLYMEQQIHCLRHISSDRRCITH